MTHLGLYTVELAHLTLRFGLQSCKQYPIALLGLKGFERVASTE
jgi:hypothetical protein